MRYCGSGYVKLTLTVNKTDIIEDADDFELEVRQAGTGYGLFDGKDQYGGADGTSIIFNLSGTNSNNEPVALTFTGKK